ncbi:MAG: sugar-binding domain-containing protein [Anaerolineaceae bacterium]|nr:sugar-binding domain-containing protein [Anaerolineaceae bacterium]
MAEIARYYYVDKLQQEEIGRQYGYSTSTISRLLKESIDEGIVEIIIHYPFESDPKLENELRSLFPNLLGVHVIPFKEGSYAEIVDTLGSVAASVLSRNLQDGYTLGLSLGMAVAATIRQFKAKVPMHVRVIRLQGATDGEMVEGTNLAQVLASQLGNDSIIIPSPWILSSAVSRELIMQEQSVKEVLEMAGKADIGLVGVGCMEAEFSTIFRNYLISQQELNQIKLQGGVGEICGKYFDRFGNIMDVEFNSRSVSIDLNKMKTYKNVIGVVGSPAKAEAVTAAIGAGYVKTLITDSRTALRILARS